MQDRHIQIDYDDGDLDWFVLREIDVANGRQVAKSLLASNGFDLRQLRDALLATGSVHDREGCLVPQRDVTALALSKFVSEMFEYFLTPDVPGPELRVVRVAVDAYDEASHYENQIPMFAYAWLDIMVREDLAEEVRGTLDVWDRSPLAVDRQRCCQRRVEELFARYEVDAAGQAANRMAPSSRRRARNDQASKSG